MKSKLFEFLQETNSDELKIRKNNIILQWVCYNGFVAMVFASLGWLC